MKINKFDIMCALAVDDNGMLTGWFETPAKPHVRYDIEIDLGPLIEEAEDKRLDQEIVLEGVAENCPHEELDQQGNCDQCGEKIGGQIEDEKVLLPGGEVKDVRPLATSDPEGDQQNRTDADAEKNDETTT